MIVHNVTLVRLPPSPLAGWGEGGKRSSTALPPTAIPQDEMIAPLFRVNMGPSRPPDPTGGIDNKIHATP